MAPATTGLKLVDLPIWLAAFVSSCDPITRRGKRHQRLSCRMGRMKAFLKSRVAMQLPTGRLCRPGDIVEVRWNRKDAAYEVHVSPVH